MTHIENIPHILQYGVTHMSSKNANKRFVSIGDKGLINTRSRFLLNNGRRLGEYIPFYFGVRTPMLYVMQKGFNMLAPIPAENIVYCVSSVQQIINQGLEYVFTNGHALDRFSTQYANDDISQIDEILDWEAVEAKYWRDDSDLDRTRRKEAEFLVLGDITAHAILGFIVYSDDAKDKMKDFGVDSTKVVIKPEYYF
jgi:hypothetical protein